MRPLSSISSIALAIGVTGSTLLGFGQQPQSLSSFATASVAHAQAPAFQETFDGTPSGPTAYRPANWDILVHSRDVSTWQQPESMMAGHGADCSAHPANHVVNKYEDTVFQCNGHLMTAINAGGYGAVYMAPNQLVDFSSGEATVRFDMSTLRTSGRDWVDIWVTPYEDNIPAPLDNWLPDLSGLPKRAIHIRMDTSSGSTIFRGDVINNFTETALPSNWWTGYESFLTTSAVRRDTFEMKLSKNSLKFGMPGYNFSWLDAQFPGLDWSRGVVQISHHSYNPTKDCETASCTPNTWHWDNVQISPSVPFTIESSNRGMVTASGSTVTYGAPAPAGSTLRFLGIGGNLQASYDGGPWQNLAPRQMKKAPEEVFKPYWVPVPAGTRQVTFRGNDWYGGPWAVQNPAIWSLAAPGSQVPPVAPATATAAPATVTATSVPGGQPATATPVVTAVPATPIATQPAATATMPPATPTATMPPATAIPTATQVPATATPTATSAPATPTATMPPAGGSNGPKGSLRLTGSAYAEVPNIAELALNGDWTTELWFKDEFNNSTTFNHAPQSLLIGGSTDWNADLPVQARIEWGRLIVGDRRGWANQEISYDLVGNGVAPGAWHHLAMTKSAANRRVQIVLDGKLVADQKLPGQNPAPNGETLRIGRNGEQHNWQGKLDDIRIWNIARSVADISASYRSELTGTPAGLVTNWKLNETAGTNVADSAGSPQQGILRNSGWSWTTDVHP